MIKNIIFDLGNVLVKVDLDKFKKDILSEGADGKKFDRFLNSKIFKRIIRQYETGLINTSYFVNFCLKRLGYGLSKKVFVRCFNEMLIEKPEMRKFVNDIAKNRDYTFLLLSNTNPLHWIYTKKTFPYVMLLKNFAISYKLKLYKPDLRIFEVVLKKYKFEPTQTLYIDDRIENCHAASTFGINAIHFINYLSFKNCYKDILKNK